MTMTTGGAFAPADIADFFFDHLAAQSVGLVSGFRQVRTNRATLEIPRLLSDTSSDWTDEGAEITPDDPGTDLVTATPRAVKALTYVTNEMVNDSQPEVLDMLGQSLARSVSLKLDLGFYEGSGTAPVITGLKNQTGIQTVSLGTDGAAFTNLDPFGDALGLLQEADAMGSAIVMHPRSWKSLIKLKEDSAGSNKPLLQMSAGSAAQPVDGATPARMSVGAIYGVPVWLSSQLSITETQGTAGNASSAYVYAADEVVAVLRTDPEIVADPSAAFSSDRTAVRAKVRADMVLPNPSAVARILGIVP